MNSVFYVVCEMNLGVETLSYLFLAVEVDSKLKLCAQFYCSYCIRIDIWSNYIRKVCVQTHHYDNKAYWYRNWSMIAESDNVSPEMTQVENHVE